MIRKLLTYKYYLLAAFAILLIGTVLFFQKDRFFPKSEVTLSIEGQSVLAKFKIQPSDQPAINLISQKLGVSSDWTKGVSLVLDQDSIQSLKTYLPQTVKLDFKPDRVEFNSQKLPGLLVSSLPKEVNEFASGSGRVKLQTLGDGVEVEIDDPTKLITEATASGSLKLSGKLVSNLEWLKNILKVNLKIGNQFLSGYILIR